MTNTHRTDEPIRVGDKVVFRGCPFDEQIPEELDRYNNQKDAVQVVTNIRTEKDGRVLVQTDANSSEWIHSAWFTPHTPSSEIGEQTDFSETNTTAIAFLNKCLENGHRLRIDDIEITEYKQERVVSLKPSPAFIHTHIENARREERERIIAEIENDPQIPIPRPYEVAWILTKLQLHDVTNKES